MIEIGKEYGAALFMIACEQDQKKEYIDALTLLCGAFSDEPEYLEFLSSPNIPMKERLSAIEATFAQKIPEDVLSFLLLMCEKGRLSNFESAVKEYTSLFNASQHISKAKVTSAIPLTNAEKDKLKQKLEKLCKCNVDLECEVDTNVLGGLIVEIDGNTMDGSLRYRLREIKEVMNT